MTLKQWLMTGTSAGLIALMAPVANAQDAEAVSIAYQQYAVAVVQLREAQTAGGDTSDADAALEAAAVMLAETCGADAEGELATCIEQNISAETRVEGDLDYVGYAAPAFEGGSIIDGIVDTLTGGGEEELAAEPAADPAPAEPVAEPEPAAEEPVMEEAAPEEPAVEEQPAPEPEPVPEEEMAPEPEPTPEMEAEVGVETDVALDAPAGLLSALEAYRAATAELQAAIDAGSDTAEAEARASAARDELISLCESVGLSDLDACMAAFGLELPAMPEVPAMEAPPATDEQPVAEETTPEEEPVESVEDAETVVDPEDVAPLLDSDKDAETTTEEPAPVEEQPAEQPADEQPAEQPVEPAEPAPASDQEAQVTIAPSEVQSIEAEQGTRVEASEVEPQGPSFGEVLEAIAGRIVVRFEDNRVFITNNDSDRLSRNADEYYVEELRFGRTRETIIRPNGTRIVTIRNRYGDIIRRSRITPDGREVILVYVYENRAGDFDPRDRDGDGDPDPYWYDPGRELPPLELDISAGDYVLDADDASEDRVADFLDNPPVESVRRLYSIDEVKRSSRLRDMVRRLEIGGLTFEFGKATIAPDQINALSNVAGAMLDLLERNPAETFLIEGHTDAVGSEIANLALSDRRAETVAIVLSEVFGIPPENLATQGYGERYLKIRTEEPERLNRRVTIRRITPLVAPIAFNQ